VAHLEVSSDSLLSGAGGTHREHHPIYHSTAMATAAVAIIGAAFLADRLRGRFDRHVAAA